jgi:hypothetical protein
MTQKMDSKENAELLLSVLRAHGNNVDAALKSAKDYLGGVYTVSRMVEDHIDLLPLTVVTEPYKSFFSFLNQTGLRFSEATALEAVRFLWRWKRVLRTVSGGPLQEPVVTR